MSSSSPSRQHDPNSQYLTFFLLGCTILLPWNAVLVSLPYFSALLSRSNVPNSVRDGAPSWLPLSFTASSLVALVIANGSMKLRGMKARAENSILGITALLFLLLLSSTTPSLPAAIVVPYLVLTHVIIACYAAYFQNAIMGLSGLFSPQCLQACFSGQGAIGLLVSIVQLISSVSPSEKWNEDERIGWGPTIFFFVCTAFAAYSFVLFRRLTRTDEWDKVMSSSLRSLHNSFYDDPESSPLIHTKSPSDIHVSQWKVAKKIYVWGFSVFFVFLLTLSLFPSITVRIASVSGISDKVWIPLGFVLFNGGDWFGRNLPQVPAFNRGTKNSLAWASGARLVFLPLLLFCNIRQASQADSTPIINSDIGYLLVLLAFSVSNGYVSALVMVNAIQDPSLEPVEISSASTSMTLFLYSGIAAGSLSSFAVRAWV
ncbi:hypothetical protein BT69DRAFT_1348520 [Atractiella rhizophila]|nr:hypothetical protein BT69DRAFT_1348520 [Atractiella rhizophila]